MAMQLRVARPVTDLAESTALYTGGLGLQVLGHFEDHDGFDGVMLGTPGGPVHFEFTVCRTHPVRPAPTPEDLLVFYVPDADAWERRCQAMVDAGFTVVTSFNPYWDQLGRTFEDRDGYRVVIHGTSWSPAATIP
ncbi:MAG: VOC family protein [Myxococcales bacterium]|nr:VOC family protein [Myxococcales bacterium]